MNESEKKRIYKVKLVLTFEAGSMLEARNALEYFKRYGVKPKGADIYDLGLEDA